jgi:hypothetical protein
MEKEDEGDVLLRDVYDVIPYYLKQILIKAPLKMKKLYKAIPLIIGVSYRQPLWIR